MAIHTEILLAGNNALTSIGLPAALTLPGWRRPLCPLTLCSMCTSFCKFSWERKTAFRRLHGDCFYTSKQIFPHPSSPFYFFRTDITELGFRENWDQGFYTQKVVFLPYRFYRTSPSAFTSVTFYSSFTCDSPVHLPKDLLIPYVFIHWLLCRLSGSGN